MVAEALGGTEDEAGVALVGKAGHYLFSHLARVDLHREGFLIYNVVACRPPDNKLAGMPWADEVIQKCAPNLDKVISLGREKAKENGKTFTILTLGRTAFMRIMGYDAKHPAMKEDYLC